MKKKKAVLTIAIIIALCLSGCGDSGSADQKESSSPPSESSSSVSSPSVSPSAAPSEKLEEAGDLGDYAVEIHGFELASDYDGKPAIIVSYSFQNNGEESTSGMVSLVDRAYQNGVQLDSVIVTGKDISTDQMKDVQTGASIELQAAFELTSDTAPVEFEIEEAFSFSDDKLGKTFEIAEGGKTVLSKAPSGDVSGTLGDYEVSVVSHRLSKDYEGSPAVIVTLGFTNHSSKTESFMTSVICSAFQDGVQLESAIITGEDSGSGESQMRNVKPGAGIEVQVAYVLSSESSPVSFEIEEFMSFSDDKIETSFNIA